MAPTKHKGHKLQSHPLLRVRDVELARQLDISESRTEYCAYCRASFNSLEKHRKPGTRCAMLAKEDEIRRSSRQRRERLSLKRPKHVEAKKAVRLDSPVPYSGDSSSDHNPGEDQVMEAADGAPMDLGPPNEDVLEAIHGETHVFQDGEDEHVPELPREEILHPEKGDPPADDPKKKSIPNPVPPPDGGDFLPGCIRHFDPARRAGAPMRSPNADAPEEYLTPYECWHNDWKEKHKDKDATWAPFLNSMDWYIAHWLKSCRIGHAETDRFLAIPGVSFLVFRTHIFC